MIAYRLDIKAGDIIDNKYSVVNLIGCGSYGNVFKVIDAHGCYYALKLLRLWEVTSELHKPLVAKFEQEYKTGKLTCDYLIHTLDFGVIKGNPYLLMEFCPKGDLSKIIGKDLNSLPKYAHDILQGLYMLHSEGKIHRDMKPENVLIRQNGKAALTDFGVVGEMDQSKRMSEVGWWKKRPKQVQGTPLYMAPEMADRAGGGITYLPTVDIWSFGVMMFEILSHGAFPFGNINTIEELPFYQEKAKKGNWDIQRIKDIPHRMEWISIIGKCLEPDYRKRYQNTLDILKDMSPMLSDCKQGFGTEHLSRSCSLKGLTVTQGNNIGTTYHLNRGQGRMIRVGRDTKNDIILPENHFTYVSRNHFTLEKSQDGSFWTIRDGQWQKEEHCWVTSTNGTYLNATLVSSIGLKIFTGDIITVGEYKLKVI